MNLSNKVVSLLIVLLISFSLYAQTELQKRLESLPGIVEVFVMEHDTIYNEAYKIFIRQPVDHNNSDGKYFKQRIYLSHRDESLPMVIDLAGYDTPEDRPSELAKILKSNKLVVEHRYFGESKPENMDWKYLTVEQAAKDHHYIINLFKEVYNGKWISTGISKGGQTTMFHRYFYNDDVDASVPYVAPLNIAQEDPRIYSFLRSVGTGECRKKMIEFQREVLKRADDLLPLFREESEL
jgi:hypothetical protein